MFTVTGSGVTITSLKIGAQAVNASNYTYDDATDTLTLKSSYLGGLSAGDKDFTLVTNGGTLEFTVAIVDSSPTTAVFSKAAAADIAVTIAGTAEISAVKNGTTALTATTDYTVASGVVTLKKEYFAAQENGDVTITVVTDVDDFNIVVTVAG